MSVYKHAKSPFWQYDFERKDHFFFGPTDVPVSRPKSEAKAFEAAEQRAAERLVAKIAGSGRKPATIGDAIDRWWSEHGQYLAGQDFKTALDWLKGQIGSKTMLHEITDDTVAAPVAARRTHVTPAGRDDKGVQLYRTISPRTVNRRRGHHPEWVFTFVAARTKREPKGGRTYIRGQRYPITYWGLGSQKERAWVKAGVEGRWRDLRHTAGRRVTRQWQPQADAEPPRPFRHQDHGRLL